MQTLDPAKIMVECFGIREDGLPYSFAKPCPTDPAGLQDEIDRCDKALSHSEILPAIAVGTIRARQRVAVDQLAMLQNPAFREKPRAPRIPRELCDSLIKRMGPLNLEAPWLNQELERHGVHPITLEGWKDKVYTTLDKMLTGLEVACKELDDKKQGKKKPSKAREIADEIGREQRESEQLTQEQWTKMTDEATAVAEPTQEAQEVLTADDYQIANRAYKFLADNIEANKNIESKLSSGTLTSEDLDSLLSAAIENGWNPDAAVAAAEPVVRATEPANASEVIAEAKSPSLTQQIADAPEIPFTSLIETGAREKAETERGVSDHVSQAQNLSEEMVSTETKQNIYENQDPNQETDDHVDAVAQPAGSDLPAELPVQELETTVLVERGGNLVDATTGEVLSDEETREILGFSQANEYQTAVKVAKYIRNLQDDCENIAGVAAAMINANLRIINGMLYRFGPAFRNFFKPKLKKDTKNLKLLEAGAKVYFEKTGGVRCKDRKKLNAWLRNCSDGEFKAVGGRIKTMSVRVNPENDRLEALYRAGDKSLAPFFEGKESEVDEHGLIKIGGGSSRVGWTPGRIKREVFKVNAIPMLKAGSGSEEEESE